MTDRPQARFAGQGDGADVGTAAAFLLLPVLLLIVGGMIFVGTGWVFGGAGIGARPFSGAVTVDAAKHAGPDKSVGARVLLQPGDYTVRVKDGAFSPWGAEGRPPEGWFWVLQIDVGDKHYQLGDSLASTDRAASLAAHLGQSITITVDKPTEASLWITDQTPDDDEGRLVVQIDPVRK